MNTKDKVIDQPLKGGGQELAVDQTKGGLPADELDYGKYAGAGAADKSELLIPFLTILQSNSPQVDKNEPKYIQGAEPGMILNTATNELLKGFVALVVGTDHNFVKYIPRDQGGGFEAIYPPEDKFVREVLANGPKFGKLVCDAGTRELVETFYMYVWAKAGDEPAFQAIIGFKSTGIKKFKQWRTTNDGFKYKGAKGETIIPPIWSHQYTFISVPDSNKKGKFFSWKIEAVGGSKETAFVKKSAPIWLEAAALYDSIAAGKATVQYETQGQEDADEEIPL